ncbi:PREDICTED: nucleoporin NUP188 homolog isoform X2 [Nicrophorus vespilloides]|uniref:Nucleoporin NUP188 homolog isoform X2 n=1 Tax=Nicrophorus vespilloides TaxID=110193 RepID=A0ABM1MAB1_NICVS|nr:PREDICTED: nucleoporin NUP188 homolog isoform X2 [Nicrophorus vespilloides]
MDTIPYWKNIYKTVIKSSKALTDKNILEVLTTVKSELKLGICQFKPYTTSSYNEWKKKVSKENRQLEILIQKISKSLNLDCTIAYSLFCNYVMFEYYGKVEDIIEVSNFEQYTNHLVVKLWHFYTSERMFLLKTVRHIFENKDVEPMKTFLSKLNITECRDNLVEQMKFSIDEINYKNSGNCVDIKNWVARNNVEQLELVITLILFNDFKKPTPKDALNMMVVFQEHGFAYKPPDFFEAISLSDPSSIKSVTHMEYTALLLALQYLWNSPNFDVDMTEVENVLSNIVSIPEHSVVLLSWCVMIMSIPSLLAVQKYKTFIQVHLKDCFNDCVFETLLEILEKPFLQGNILGKIIREGVYGFVNQLCSKSTDHFMIYQKKGSVDVLCKLIEDETIASKVFDTNYSVHLLISTAFNMYPYDFKSFTGLCSTLYKHKHYEDQVIRLLLNIEVYTNENALPLPTFKDVRILKETTPLHNFTIPKSSIVGTLQLSPTVWLAQCRGDFRYTYFHYLEQYALATVDYCENTTDSDGKLIPAVDRLIEGLSFIAEVVKHPQLWKNVLFCQLINHVKFLMTKGGIHKYPNAGLINSCLKICIEMLSIPEANPSILHILTAFHCLHAIPKELLSIEQLQKLNVIDDSNLLQLAVLARYSAKYDLIRTYLKLLNHTMKENNPEKFQLRGIIFFMREIFPQHLNWNYEDSFEKHIITRDILMHIFNILQFYNSVEEPKEIMLTYNFCVETFFNYEPFIKAFIAIFRSPNHYLDHLMCMETDWKDGKSTEIIRNVRRCISIILLLFKQHGFATIKTTKFWAYFIHSGAQSANCIKVIVDYIIHKYDTILPKLACRLLKTIAIDSTIPILSSLEIDNHQVQCMFLERLRDRLEDDDMKVALLDMITTCTKSQNGMTVAFFNLSSRRKSYCSKPIAQSGESVSHYLGDYLKNIKISPEYLKSPIQAAMLKLFHALWVEKKTLLIKDLIAKDTFWEIILAPLMQDYNLANETYSMILDILAIELSKTEIDPKLEVFLKGVFANEKGFLQNFPKYLMQCLKNDCRNPDNVNLLLSWKKFIIFLVRGHDDILDNKPKQIIADNTLKGFINYIDNPEEIKYVKEWADLYLYLLTKWGDKTPTDDECFKLKCILFSHISNIYDYLNKKARESVVSIALRTVDLHAKAFEETSTDVLNFMKSVGTIIEKEYDTFMKNRKKSQVLYIDYISWTILISLCNRVVQKECFQTWFFYTQIFNKVFNTLGFLMSNIETMPLVKTLTIFLTKCVKSPLSYEFLYVNFQTFFDSIKLPQQFYNFSLETLKEGNPLHLEEFWITFTSLINMNLSLIDKFGFFMFYPILEFMNMHYTEIVTIIKLPQYTVNNCALKLVSNTLKLCNSLFKWKRKWRMFNEPLLTAFYKIIAECLNSCINIVLSPKVLKFYKIADNQKLHTVEKIPVEFLVSTMDRVVEIISSSCLCLISLSPRMVDLLAESKTHENYFDGFDYEFHIPNPNNPHDISYKLTFGGVLCLVHYLCKTIIQRRIYVRNYNEITRICFSRLISEKGSKICKRANILKVYISF